jgi:preprotein translocase subunit YajC
VEGLAGLALPVLFIAVLYMLLIRPQQKRAKEHRQLVSNLNVGSDVVTIGGLHGRVVDLTDETMDLEVTDDIVLRFQRSSLARVVRDELVEDLDDDVVDDEELVDEAADDTDDHGDGDRDDDK